MRLIIILALLFLSSNSYSQDQKHFDKGVELFNSEDYSKALASFKKFQKKKDGPSVKFYIAGCYLKMNDFDQAKNHYLEIIDSYENHIEAGWSMVNLGSCYRELNKIDSAIFYYSGAAKAYPSSGANYNLAQLFYHLDEFSKAKEQYDLAIKRDSTNALYYSKRQEINFILLDYESALSDMLLARKYNPEYYEPINEAFCHSMMGNYAKADSVFLLIFDEKDPFFLNNFGFNKHKMGNTDEGVRLIHQSLKINPNNSFAYRNLAVIDIDKDEINAACINLQKAKELKFFTDYGNEVNELSAKFCK